MGGSRANWLWVKNYVDSVCGQPNHNSLFIRKDWDAEQNIKHGGEGLEIS